jgi:hypothetical protein
VPHECADGSTLQGTLLVQTTRDFGAPDTEDQDPTARLQIQAVCPGGISFTWGAPPAPATITSTANLKSVTSRKPEEALRRVPLAWTFLAARTGFEPVPPP